MDEHNNNNITFIDIKELLIRHKLLQDGVKIYSPPGVEF